MNYLHVSCPSGDLSYLWLVNLQTPRVRLSIYDTAQTSPRPRCPLLMSGEKCIEWVMVASMVHAGVDLLAGPVLGGDECKEQSLGAVGLTEVMACKQHR